MSEPTIPTVTIANVPISRLGLEKTLNLFESWIDTGLKKHVCVLPVNNLIWANKSPELMEVYQKSHLNLADGVPLVMLSRLIGEAIESRVTGLDVLPLFSGRALKKEYSFFFLGSTNEVLNELKMTLQNSYPGLKICGTLSPPFQKRFTDEQNTLIIEKINLAHPDVLWVAMTAPKQDFWISENFEKLNCRIAIGVGAAFEVTAGVKKRAPVWMQKYSLEWFYRFIQEPKRLFGRYFIEGPYFFLLVFKQLSKKIIRNSKKNKISI